MPCDRSDLRPSSWPPGTDLPTPGRGTPPGPGRRHGGFTLIELLAVIAIIGVLTGILIPTLSGARESARRTQCLANLAQIGVATQMYLDTESKGVLPVVRPFHQGEPGGGSDPSLLDVLSTYLDTPVPRRSSPDEDFVLPGNSCYRCPSDRGDPADGGRPLWASAGTSYEYFPGLVMTAAEVAFAATSPRLERAVTKALELQAESGRPAPLLNCAGQWHKLRIGGPTQNAVYFPSMRADWLEELSAEDARSLFEQVGRLLDVR